MAWMIGVDEAGYGPNLGPLVVAATAWHCDATSNLASSATTNAPPIDLYDILADVVCLTRSDNLIAIADSKRLYQPGKGLRHLERGVHTACAAVQRGNHSHSPGVSPGKSHSPGILPGDSPSRPGGTPGLCNPTGQCDQPGGTPWLCCWSELLEFLQADPDNRRTALPWHDGFDCPLPIDATDDELLELGELFHAKCAFVGVRPVAMRARLVFPAEFNDACTRHGGKGVALSRITLALVRSLCDEIEPQRAPSDGPIRIVCDKHGGRNKYGALLRHDFPEYDVQRRIEGLAESRYHCTAGDMFSKDAAKLGDVDICFRTKGEAFLPTALASMIAKYLRELAMRAENQFWSQHVQDLRPTAGYPVDAHRFKSNIAEAQAALAIDDHILWRER